MLINLFNPHSLMMEVHHHPYFIDDEKKSQEKYLTQSHVTNKRRETCRRGPTSTRLAMTLHCLSGHRAENRRGLLGEEDYGERLKEDTKQLNVRGKVQKGLD